MPDYLYSAAHWLRWTYHRLFGECHRLELSSAFMFQVGDTLRIGHVDDDTFVDVLWTDENCIWIREASSHE